MTVKEFKEKNKELRDNFINKTIEISGMEKDIDILNEEISIEEDIKSLDEDTLFDEYMAITEEMGYELEEYFPEDSIIDFKAYKWDPSDNDIKAVIVIANEELGEGKVKDIIRRLLTQVE